MTKQNLTILVILVVILGVVFFILDPKFKDGGKDSNRALLEVVDVERISSIVLEQGESKVELKRDEDGNWTVPSRGNYPAQGNRVKSLLLKIYDLSTSQQIPAGKDGLKKLGLDEAALKGGRARVRIYDREGSELGGLFLGNVREKKSAAPGPGGFSPPGGQFVRRTSDEQVYLVSTPLMVVTTLSHWLDTTVANVLQSKVHSVTQRRVGDQAGEVEFSLVRKGESLSGDLLLQGEIGEDQELQSSLISQVGAGLENLRIEDVSEASSDNVKDLKYDFETEYQIANGLVYTLRSAEEDDKVFATLSVRYDAELGKKLEEIARREAEEKKKQEEEAQKKEKEEDESGEESAEGEESSADEKDSGDEEKKEEESEEEEAEAKPLVELSSDKEAKEINERYKPWVFQFAKFQGEKFRKNRADLVKKKEKEEKKEEKAEGAGEV
jgi:hypothetical protein